MSDPRRILLFGASFGGVHRASTDALAEYLRSHDPHLDVRSVDFLERFAPNLNVLARFAYQQPGEFFPAFTGTFAELAQAAPGNPLVAELAGGALERTRAYAEEFRPHAIVSTFWVAGAVASEFAGVLDCLSATVLTDLDATSTWIHPDTDLYFVASKEAREGLTLRGIAWERLVVSGVPVSERFATLPSKRECREGLGLADRFSVVIAPSIAATVDVKQAARRLVSSGIQVVIATGSNERLKRSVESLESQSGLVRVFGSGQDTPRMAEAADVVACGASASWLSEALAAGVPVVVMGPVPGHEVRNVDFVVNSGAGLWARDEEDVVGKVGHLSTHHERLAQMARDAGAIGVPSAAQNVCQRVLASIG